MQNYLDLLNDVKLYGLDSKDRTGVGTRRLSGALFRHNFSDGFPLMTVKKMNPNTIFTELEFFIKGYNNKLWLQERKCKIWDEWCSPMKVPYGKDSDTQKLMKEEEYLGPVYGVNWRHWGTRPKTISTPTGWELSFDDNNRGVDQLFNAVETLRKDPTSRRMLVNAWNVEMLNEMALPPCHFAFQLLSDGENLDLVFYMRSVDIFLGLPFNIASYAMLTLLIAKTVGMKPRSVIGMLSDAHIYHNHNEQVDIVLAREPRKLPIIKIPDDVNLWNWTCKDFEISEYNPHSFVSAPIAI